MPSVAAASTKSLSIVKKSDEKRDFIMRQAEYLRSKLKSKNISYINSDSHIVPVMAYESESAKMYSKMLKENFGVYIQPIFYPTVPKGAARLRITITPKHSKKDIDELVYALDTVIKKNILQDKPLERKSEHSGAYL